MRKKATNNTHTHFSTKIAMLTFAEWIIGRVLGH